MSAGIATVFPAPIGDRLDSFADGRFGGGRAEPVEAALCLDAPSVGVAGDRDEPVAGVQAPAPATTAEMTEIAGQFGNMRAEPSDRDKAFLGSRIVFGRRSERHVVAAEQPPSKGLLAGLDELKAWILRY
ncbi:hypothetical protein [Amycolatopsis japonica]